jgi:hypothetical protein
MDTARLHLLLTEARAAAQELRDIRRPIVVSPGHLHSLAQCLTDLTDTCQHLHRWGLHWRVVAARQMPPGGVRRATRQEGAFWTPRTA